MITSNATEIEPSLWIARDHRPAAISFEIFTARDRAPFCVSFLGVSCVFS
jgi:hypothetical protein